MFEKFNLYIFKWFMHLKFVYENPFKVKVVYIFFHILCLPVGCSLTSHSFSLVQFSHSVMSDSLQLHGLTRACQASLSINNSRSLLKLMSIEAVMPSNHLILYHPLLLPHSIIPSIRVFSNESVLRIRWPKHWSFSFSNSLSNEYSGLISLRKQF